jgi:5-methylcytosine-specific restriction endonuclease McrA
MPKDPRDSRAWRAVSKAVLARDNYTCAYCYGEATTTDHIESVKYRPELALSLDNLVASCKPCNSRKGSKPRSVFLATTFTPPVFFKAISLQEQPQSSQNPFVTETTPIIN